MSESANQPEDGTVSLDVPAAKHSISIEYQQYFEDEILIEGGNIIEVQDTDGYFGQNETISCECGETFLSRPSAREHLEEVVEQHNGLPLPNLPEQVVWEKGETTTVKKATIVPEAGRGIGKVVDNDDHLKATAQKQISPPEAYGFEDWGELQEGGALHNEEFEPLFREGLLKRALGWVTERAMLYDPDRYTIYFRGHKELLLEGPERAVVVAPVE